jgi:hypothetical protein
MSELDEVADSLRTQFAATFFYAATLEEAIAFVRVTLRDETPEVIDGVAQSLWESQ